MAAPTPGIERFLAEMEYPATKDDLLREATRDGLPPADIAMLRALPDGGYDARCRVRDALAVLPQEGGLLVG